MLRLSRFSAMIERAMIDAELVSCLRTVGLRQNSVMAENRRITGGRDDVYLQSDPEPGQLMAPRV